MIIKIFFDVIVQLPDFVGLVINVVRLHAVRRMVDRVVTDYMAVIDHPLHEIRTALRIGLGHKEDALCVVAL